MYRRLVSVNVHVLRTALILAIIGMALVAPQSQGVTADITCYDFAGPEEPQAVLAALPNDPFGLDTGWPLPSGFGSGDQEAGNGVACDAEISLPENASPGNEPYEISPDPALNGLAELPNGDLEQATVQDTQYLEAIQTVENPSKFYSIMSVATPEYEVYSDYEDREVPGQCGADAATARIQELLAPGTTIWLETDEAGFFTQNFLDRHIWVNLDGRYRLVSEILVSEGLAVVATERPGTAASGASENPPDGSMYRDALRAAQVVAIAGGRGIWSACAG